MDCTCIASAQPAVVGPNEEAGFFVSTCENDIESVIWVSNAVDVKVKVRVYLELVDDVAHRVERAAAIIGGARRKTSIVWTKSKRRKGEQ